MTINKQINVNFVSSVFFALFWFLFFVSTFAQSKIIVDYSKGLCAVIGCLMFLNVFKKNEKIYLCFLPLLVFGIFGVFFSYNVRLIFVVFFFGTIGSAPFINSFRTKRFYSIVLLLLNLLFILVFFSGISLNTFFYQASENYVSVYLLLFFFLHSEEMLCQKKKPSLFLVLLSLLTCFFAHGRMGIICFLILSVAATVYKILNNHNKNIIIFLFIAISICVSLVLFLNFKEEIVDLLNDTPRLILWDKYLTSLKSVDYLIRGVPFNSDEIFKSYMNNMHNAFFNIHARYGIFVLISFFFLVGFSIVVFLYKKDFWHLSLFLVILLRSLSDDTCFFGSLDIPLLISFIIALNYCLKNKGGIVHGFIYGRHSKPVIECPHN